MITLSNGAEAVAAVAVTVIAADSTGSLEERDILYQNLSGMDAFSGMDGAAITTMVNSTTEKIFAHFPMTDAGTISADAMATVFETAATHLDDAGKRSTFQLAIQITDAEGADSGDLFMPAGNIDATESAALSALRTAFGFSS